MNGTLPLAEEHSCNANLVSRCKIEIARCTITASPFFFFFRGGEKEKNVSFRSSERVLWRDEELFLPPSCEPAIRPSKLPWQLAEKWRRENEEEKEN